MKIVNLLPDYFIEHEYFNLMITYFNHEILKDKIVYLTHNYKELPSYGRNVIVILTAGDEKGGLPSYHDKVLVVFKHHLDKDNIFNVFHIPLPYVGGFVGNSSIPIDKRKYDVFFAGRSQKRADFIEELDKLQNKRKDIVFRVFITGYKFKEGWPIEKYSREMMNSKIVLSPRGAVRAECLRFTEAVKCGCAIITCKHPNVTCFNTCPAKYINKWNELEKSIDEIIKNKKILLSVNDGMNYCWKKYYSPEAIGKYINNIVKTFI